MAFHFGKTQPATRRWMWCTSCHRVYGAVLGVRSLARHRRHWRDTAQAQFLTQACPYRDCDRLDDCSVPWDVIRLWCSERFGHAYPNVPMVNVRYPVPPEQPFEAARAAWLPQRPTVRSAVRAHVIYDVRPAAAPSTSANAARP